MGKCTLGASCFAALASCLRHMCTYERNSAGPHVYVQARVCVFVRMHASQSHTCINAHHRSQQNELDNYRAYLQSPATLSRLWLPTSLLPASRPQGIRIIIENQPECKANIHKKMTFKMCKKMGKCIKLCKLSASHALHCVSGYSIITCHDSSFWGALLLLLPWLKKNRGLSA
jgi:hypothetical protein